MHQLPFEIYLQEHQHQFKGWDFSCLTRTSRMHESPLPWNYFNLVKPYLLNSDKLLDMGTGGGEFLSALAPLPAQTYATEAYEPNVEIAQNRLKAFGVEVVPIRSDEELPFESESFQLIINRHEAFDSAEVNRILKTGGVFITQQVGGRNDREFNEILGAQESEYTDWNLNRAASHLKNSGMEMVNSNEVMTKTRFYDLGAVLTYLNIIEWQIKDFSIEKYSDGLRKIYKMIDDAGYIDITCHRFILIASKEG